MTVQFKRIIREKSIKINASKEDLFKVLCLVREREWLPKFSSEIVFTESRVTELDSVFFTNSNSQEKTVWIIPAYEKYNFIEMVYIQPNIKVATIKLSLSEISNHKTKLKVKYIYTAISDFGNRELDTITESNFYNNINSWEVCLNYYFKNKTLIPEDLLAIHH